MKSPVCRMGVLVAVAVLLAALMGTGALAEKGGGLYSITDDINPVTWTVDVVVGNSAGSTRSGYVEVRASFNGIPTRRVEPVAVGGHGTTTVKVFFGQGLEEIIVTAIIEDPDPIPPKA